MTEIKVIRPKSAHSLLYYSVGGVFLSINKLRHSIQGYTNPRPFPITDFQRAIEYDYNVVQDWIWHLNNYLASSVILKGKKILELGPGADLGTGVILVMKGAEKYYAMDVNNFKDSVPDPFYENLFDYVSKIEGSALDKNDLHSQLKLTHLGKSKRFDICINKDFDLSVFRGEGIDLVFSQASFEHFDDVERTISKLSEVVKPRAVLIAEVDLKTHTRWIRDWDPLNIYRYSNFIYNLSKFSGSPNRVRPFEYKRFLEKHGWTNIEIKPLAILDSEYFSLIVNSLDKRFRDPINQMDYLSIMICATKKG